MDYQALYDMATDVVDRAYAPYSNFKVGAAMLAKDGRVFTGINVESSAYGAAVCAERTALVKGVSEGCLQIKAMAVVSRNQDGLSAETFPCGICRQMIYEFGDDIDIIIGKDRDHLKVFKIKELLPFGFRLHDQHDGAAQGVERTVLCDQDL